MVFGFCIEHYLVIAVDFVSVFVGFIELSRFVIFLLGFLPLSLFLNGYIVVNMTHKKLHFIGLVFSPLVFSPCILSYFVMIVNLIMLRIFKRS